MKIYSLLVWAAIALPIYGQSQLTPNVQFNTPYVNAPNWNNLLNANFNKLDLILSGNQGVASSLFNTLPGPTTPISGVRLYLNSDGSLHVRDLNGNDYALTASAYVNSVTNPVNTNCTVGVDPAKDFHGTPYTCQGSLGPNAGTYQASPVGPNTGTGDWNGPSNSNVVHSIQGIAVTPPPSGILVGRTDTQPLTNKDLTSGTNTFPNSLPSTNAGTATALVALPTPCTGTQKPSGIDVNGNSVGCSTAGGTPGGSPNQIQFNNAGSFGGAAIGTGLSLTSTLDLLPPTLSAIGGVQAINASTHLWIDAISVLGVPHVSQPAAADISGLGALAIQNAPTSGQIATGLGYTAQNSATANTNNDALGAAATVLSTSAQKTANLSDLANAATARTNLGLGSIAPLSATNTPLLGAPTIAGNKIAAVRVASLPGSCVAGTDGSVLFTNAGSDVLYACDNTGHYVIIPGGSTTVLAGDTTGPGGSNTVARLASATYSTGVTGGITNSSVQNRLTTRYSITTDFGAVAWTRSACTTTSSSASIHCTGAPFTPSMVGINYVLAWGAGVGGNTLVGQISTYVGPSDVTLSVAATSSLTNTTSLIGIDNSTQLQNALNWALTGTTTFGPNAAFSSNSARILESPCGNFVFLTPLTMITASGGGGPQIEGIGPSKTCSSWSYYGATALDALTIGASNGFRMNGGEIRNLYIVGNQNSPNALSLKNTQEFKLTDVGAGPAAVSCVYEQNTNNTSTMHLNYSNNAFTWPTNEACINGHTWDGSTTQAHEVLPFASSLTGAAAYIKSGSGIEIHAAQYSQNCHSIQIDSGNNDLFTSGTFEQATCSHNVIFGTGAHYNHIETSYISGNGPGGVGNSDVQFLSGAAHNVIDGASTLDGFTPINIASGATDNVISNSDYGPTVSQTTDAGSGTEFHHLTVSGSLKKNFPADQFCWLQGGALGGAGDPVCKFGGDWSLASGTLAISPHVFTVSKAWVAHFHGNWFHTNGQSTTIPNELWLNDSNNTVSDGSAGAAFIVSFSVDATTGQFEWTYTSGANTAEFQGEIYFYPLGVAAGSAPALQMQMSGGLTLSSIAGPILNITKTGATAGAVNMQMDSAGVGYLLGSIGMEIGIGTSTTPGGFFCRFTTAINCTGAMTENTSFAIGSLIQWTQATGLMTKYNNQATTGVGQPYILGNVNDVNRTASLGSTNLIAAPTAGLYRIDAYASSNSTICTAAVALGWTDNNGAQTATPIAATLTSGSGSQLVKVASGAITYSITIAAGACVGGTGFNTQLVATRLQ